MRLDRGIGGQAEAIRLAERHGFESVEAYGDYLAGLDDVQRKDLADEMKAKASCSRTLACRWNSGGTTARFTDGLKKLRGWRRDCNGREWIA